MFKNLIKRCICLFYKVKFLRKATIKITSTLLNGCAFEGQNRVGSRNYLNNISMGMFSCIGDGNSFCRTVIGRYCSIGSNVKVVSAIHPIEAVSTSRVFYRHGGRDITFNNNFLFIDNVTDKDGHCLVVGNDVWIGDNVIIKGGVHIGNGAVVGMGAVVTKDVPPYAIVGGNPAKIIRYRFDDKIIKDIQKTQWWDWPVEKIRDFADAFPDPESFLREYADKEAE